MRYFKFLIFVEQSRVEFESFRLSPPNPNTTICDEDYFTAVGSTTPTPKLCGDSYNDQHRNKRKKAHTKKRTLISTEIF